MPDGLTDKGLKLQVECFYKIDKGYIDQKTKNQLDKVGSFYYGKIIGSGSTIGSSGSTGSGS